MGVGIRLEPPQNFSFVSGEAPVWGCSAVASLPLPGENFSVASQMAGVDLGRVEICHSRQGLSV